MAERFWQVAFAGNNNRAILRGRNGAWKEGSTGINTTWQCTPLSVQCSEPDQVELDEEPRLNKSSGVLDKHSHSSATWTTVPCMRIGISSGVSRWKAGTVHLRDMLALYVLQSQPYQCTEEFSSVVISTWAIQVYLKPSNVGFSSFPSGLHVVEVTPQWLARVGEITSLLFMYPRLNCWQ
ncbi:hypothetical protein KL928_004063 [Ogataea angusta]|uniref:Uncharacterized protein n=1 Tax=Pichia angusta TaxID=870730 RepID=A0AAN6DE89_PICAN|nr:uncharacterized protein KL928_004063 [Ogataea angusta]KAG7817328.1 hypothetical protein KL928_004063 [Ogataea angusta]